MTAPAIELLAVSKGYHGIRPLRIEALTVGAGEQVAILGLDQPMAEVLVNLLTGATLPDRGEVRVLGRSTAAIQDSAEWLSMVDRFGVVSLRAVLLEQLSAIQNLAIPFTLDVEPPPAPVREQAEELAREVELSQQGWTRAVAELGPFDQARVRLGRALALDPAILLIEHASAAIPAAHQTAFGRAVRRIASRRGSAMLAFTADRTFAEAVAPRVLALEAATGRLTGLRGPLSHLFGR